MPSWKKIIASGSDASFSSATVDTYVSASSFKGSFTGSLFGTSSQALTASYLLGYTSGFPYSGSAQITGSLGVTGSLNVSGTISAQLANVSQPNFVAYNTATGLFTYANTGSFTATSASYSATASYVNPLRQTVIISGSLIVSASTSTLSIQGSGSNVFSVDGTSGRLFQVDDSLSGSLFSVNTAAGLPVIEAFSDNTVRIGQFGQKALFVSQSRVGVGTEIPTANLDVSGSGRFTNGLSLTGSVQITGSLGITGSINSTGNITTTGTLTAQTLVVQTITSSITYSSGSNIFGNSTANTQTMTGSLNVSGSATIVGRVTATDLTGSLFGTASQALTASYLLGGGGVVTFPYSGSAQITGSLAVTGSISTNAGFYVSNTSMNFGPNGVNSLSLGNSAGSLSLSNTILSLGSATTTQTNLYGAVNITGSLGVTGSASINGFSSFYGSISGSQPVNNPSSSIVLISGSVLPNSGSTAGASAMYMNTVMSASANNQTLVGLDINPTFTNGAFTGVSNIGLRVQSGISSFGSTVVLNGNTLHLGANNGNTLLRNSGNNTQLFNNNSGGILYLNAAGSIDFGSNTPASSTWARFFNTGNLLIQNGGTFTDAGYRLDVNGTARVQSSLSVSQSLFTNQNTASLGSSTQTVSTNSTSSYTSAFYRYSVVSGSNARAGEFIVCWNGSSVQYTDYSTTDIGNTSLVALTASLSAGNVVLTTVLPSSGWNVNTLVNLL